MSDNPKKPIKQNEFHTDGMNLPAMKPSDSQTPPLPTELPVNSSVKKPVDEVIRDQNFKKEVVSQIIHGKIGNFGSALHKSPTDMMLEKLETAITDAQNAIQLFIQQGAAFDPEGRMKMREMLFSVLSERFDKFSNDELMNILTIVIGDRLMQDVDASPWGMRHGGGGPDLMSGR